MRHPLERLMRHHPVGRADPDTDRVLDILSEADPVDVFSRAQWSLGIDYFEQRLAAWGLAGEACLDFGCGSGNWTIAAARRFRHVVGIDVHERRLRSATAIRDALAIDNVSFAAQVPDEGSPPFDCILLYNVLPYIADRSAVAGRLIRRLEPAGRLVVAFNEIGVCPYYLFSGLRAMRPSYLKRAFVGPKYVFVERVLRRRAPFESTHGWLRTRDVLAFFASHGCDAVWTSWQALADTTQRPLFPATHCGLPFFREIVFQKR